MATRAEATTAAYKLQQNRRAAAIAAVVAAYYRSKVNIEDPDSIERWLDLMLPRILREHDNIANLGSLFATEIRRLELPDASPLRFEPSVGAVAEQVRTSLRVVGPTDYANKMRDIRRLDLDPLRQRALEADAKQVTARKVASSVVRHAQAGGRQTIIDAVASDRLALGYVRVTRAKPCFFCAMLASRGLVFAQDSFDMSDPRFTGDGTVKVHDECGCTMKPVYNRKTDEAMQAIAPFEDMWSRWGAGGGDALLRFRRGYDHWLATGDFLDYDIVNDSATYRAR
jgi:hypothetical protein